MARRERDRLADIARAIGDIEGFVAGMDAASFAADSKTLLAVQAAFTVIGEAIKALPEETRRRHPHARWSGYARLRDVIVHQYFRVEPGLLWKVIARDLPRLRDAVQRELEADSSRP